MAITNTSQEGFDRVVMNSLVEHAATAQHCYEDGSDFNAAWGKAKALIEAAPDLLKALEAMHRAATMLNSLHNDSDWHEVGEAEEAFTEAEKRYKAATARLWRYTR